MAASPRPIAGGPHLTVRLVPTAVGLTDTLDGPAEDLMQLAVGKPPVKLQVGEGAGLVSTMVLVRNAGFDGLILTGEWTRSPSHLQVPRNDLANPLVRCFHRQNCVDALRQILPLMCPLRPFPSTSRRCRLLSMALLPGYPPRPTSWNQRLTRQSPLIDTPFREAAAIDVTSMAFTISLARFSK